MTIGHDIVPFQCLQERALKFVQWENARRREKKANIMFGVEE
jgi:hypothetical protein